jgi:hypothetical protein
VSSPLSFMIGLRPTGLSEFVEMARPVGIYGLNNSPVYADTLSILRVQDDTWGRLPDACSVDRYFETEDPVVSADYELLIKTQYIPSRGNVTLIEKWMLNTATWRAPYNEWALDEGPDSFLKADWMNAWTCRALEIAHGAGLKLCIGSFATGNPALNLLPHLYPMFRLAKSYGGILDVHEYGVEGALMSSPSSGALRYRELYEALPEDCRIPIVISEFWWGNGFEESNVGAQIEDARQYGLEIVKDDYLLWASAFQLDEQAESNFTPDAVTAYASVAAEIQKEEEPPMGKGGLHLSANGNNTDDPSLPVEIQAMQTAKLTRCKFMSNGNPEFVHILQAGGIDLANSVCRLYAAGDNNVLGDPARFYLEQRAYITEVYGHGVRMFEIHNEPNLASEGMGRWWNTPAEFAANFYAPVARLIKDNFPGVQCIYPGLSPKDDWATWKPSITSLISQGLVDLVGVHCYWDSAVNMRSATQGRTFERFADMGRDLIITEASHNVNNVSDTQKGTEYAEYISTLPSYVRGVYFFVSYGPAYDSSGETWVRGNPPALTAIPAAVGSDGSVPPAPTYKLLHYHIDGGTAQTTNPFQIVMNQAHSVLVEAIEVSPEKFFLIVTVAPEGALTVTLNPPQPADGYDIGTVVTVAIT